jgi:putative addiction module component (TIGR02574 family)
MGTNQAVMSPAPPHVSQLLKRALRLSTQDRRELISRLIASLDDESAEDSVEASWGVEIERRVEDIRSGRVKTLPGERVLREIAKEFHDVQSLREAALLTEAVSPRKKKHRDRRGRTRG